MNLHMRRFPPEASSPVVFLTVDRSACCSVRPSLPIFVPEPEASVRALCALPLTPAKFPPEHVRSPPGRWVQLRVTFSDATLPCRSAGPESRARCPRSGASLFAKYSCLCETSSLSSVSWGHIFSTRNAILPCRSAGPSSRARRPRSGFANLATLPPTWASFLERARPPWCALPTALCQLFSVTCVRRH